MPQIDVVDSTWMGVAPPVVAAAVAEPVNWPRWWPELVLRATELRGVEGVRWAVRAPGARAAGAMEIWIQPALDGAIVHYLLQLDFQSPRSGGSRRRSAKIADRSRRNIKQVLWALADELDPERIARLGGSR